MFFLFLNFDQKQRSYDDKREKYNTFFIIMIRMKLRIPAYLLSLISTPTLFLEGFELLLGALLRGSPVTFTVLGRMRNAL